MSKGTPLTDAQKDVYLAEIARTGLVTRSAGVAGATPEAFWALRQADPEFKARFEGAKKLYGESLEGEAHRRGVEGVEEAVYHKDKVVGKVKRYSDRLLELLLKRHVAEYREKISADVSLGGGVLVVGTPAADAEEWAKRVDGGKS